MQRKFKVGIVMISILLLFNNISGAQQLRNTSNIQEIKMENVTMRYLAAWTALAVYNDKLSLLARSILQENGWQINTINEELKKSDIKLLLAEKEIEGKTLYFLSISGTATWKDIQTDLTVESTTFNQKNKAFLVHKGFWQYMQDGFFTEKEYDGKSLGEKLAERLQADKSQKIYITGHSLGGAVAELLAAKLSDMGVEKNQLEVITFGAPAVGNEAFVNEYEPKMNLTRITMKGDPIKNLAQIANTKYVQFTTNMQWTLPQNENDKFAHGMLLYFDRAMRDYYDEVQFYHDENSIGNVNCIVSFGFDFPEELKDEEKFIQLALKDKLKHNERNCLFIDEENLQEGLKQVKNSQAKQIIVYQFSATKLRENTSNKRYYINEMKYIYDINGNLLNGFSASTDTNEMTVLQAVLYADSQIDKM